MLTEYLLVLLIFFVIGYALVKGCSININISVKQEFSHEDRQLLEDLFNDKGELKNQDHDIQDSFDELVKNVNDLMLGVEDDTNG